MQCSLPSLNSQASQVPQALMTTMTLALTTMALTALALMLTAIQLHGLDR